MTARIATAALTATVVFGAVADTQAADKRTVGGSILAIGGVLTALAFDYKGHQCPQGYSTHMVEGLPTQCLYISDVPPYDTDIRDATTAVTLKRKGMLWSGIGAMGFGAVIAMLPDDSPVADIDVGVDPARGGWRATKTIGWQEVRSGGCFRPHSILPVQCRAWSVN